MARYFKLLLAAISHCVSVHARQAFAICVPCSKRAGASVGTFLHGMQSVLLAAIIAILADTKMLPVGWAMRMPSMHDIRYVPRFLFEL